jgi:ABC-type transport system substrate-binding protein
MAALAVLAVSAVTLAACGGNGNTTASTSGTPVTGGTLKLLGSSDVDHLDTASAYYTASYTLERTFARQLFSYPASTNTTTANTPVPDLATALPTTANGGISADGKTYTIHLKVRQAIEYAIDKTATGQVYGGPALNTPLNQVIPPGNVGYQAFDLYPTAQSKGDAATCKSMLSAAGYPNGLTIKDVYRNAGDHPAVAQDIQADLKACGITDKLVPVNQGDYYGKYLNSLSAPSAASGTSASPAGCPTGTATTAARSSSRCSTGATTAPTRSTTATTTTRSSTR